MRRTKSARCCGLSASMAGAIVLGLSLAGCGSTPPSQPSAAAAAEEGAKPDTPAKPATAMEPAKPVQPEKPAQPAEAMKAATPSGPQQPAQPAEPASPGGDESLAVLKVPADDLVAEANRYVAAIGEAVASEDDYKDAKEELARDSNVVIAIARALGEYHLPAKSFWWPEVMTAARAVAQAKDYVAAKKAAGELKAALERNAKTNDLTDLSSTPPASLAQLMKEVPILNTRLKRNVQGERLKSEAKETAGSSAVIAAIAVGSISSTEAAKTPAQVAQWRKFCVELRDAATAANAGIHAGDPAATATEMTKLAKSCDDCHAVFHKEKDKDK